MTLANIVVEKSLKLVLIGLQRRGQARSTSVLSCYVFESERWWTLPHLPKQEVDEASIMSRIVELVEEELQKTLSEDDDWIQDVDADIERRGTEGVCTGDKFGSDSCPPGSRRYNLAKTFRRIAKDRKKD